VSTRVIPSGLYALVDEGLCPERPVTEKARLALEGGARVLQLRMKAATSRDAIRTIRDVAALCRVHGAVCLVNDRVDWALASGADGVHLGDDDLPVAEARRLLGPGALIGRTTRNLEDIRRAQAEGADHVGLGPVFKTSTKAIAHPLLGVEGLARIAAESPLPIVAIAGITLENIEAVSASGVHCAAVASDLLCAADPTDRARRLQDAFAKGRAQRTIADR
jgi:thiamine-phosphate pyrophosphorylase